VDWFDLSQNVAGSCERGNEPLVSINVGTLVTSLGTVSFSRRNLLHGVS
jgi:hypothetical protein